MNRRNFVRDAAMASALIAGAGLWACKGKGGPQARIKWSMGWLLWRDFEKRQIPLAEAIQNLSDLGVDGVEFTPRPGELDKHGFTRESLRDLFQEKNLKLAGNYFTGDFFNPSKKEEIVADLKGKIDFLQFFGAKNIVVGPPGRENGEPTELIKAMAPMLNELGKMASDSGIELGLHPHLNTIVEGPDEIELAMELLDDKLVFMAPDTGHLYLGGNDVTGTFRKYADRIRYIHFKDGQGQFIRPDFLGNITELGAGEVDFAGVMNLLKEINYTGWINVEQDHTFMTPEKSSKESMAFINTKLKPLYT